VAGEPDRLKAPDQAKAWRTGEGIMSKTRKENPSVAKQGEIQAMRKLVKSSPQDPEVWDSLGKSLYGAGQYDEAVNAFRESLKIKPNVVDVLANLGVTLKTSGRKLEYDKLMEELARVDAKTAKELESFVPRNQTVAKSSTRPPPSFAVSGPSSPAPAAPAAKKRSSATSRGEIDALRKLVAMDDRDSVAWDKLGKTLFLTGDYNEAVDCFKKSLAIKPDVIEVLANLGVTLKTKNDQADYEEVVRKLSALDAKTAEDLKKYEPPSGSKP
jgi:cytochrome c-type biogenesis protein CcmH/NrfG